MERKTHPMFQDAAPRKGARTMKLLVSAAMLLMPLALAAQSPKPNPQAQQGARQSPKPKPPVPTAQQDTKPPAASQYGAWILLGSAIDPMTDEKVTIFNLPSREMQNGKPLAKIVAKLAGSKLYDLFVLTHFSIVKSGRYGVNCNLRFDKEKAREVLFGSTHNALFLSDPQGAEGFRNALEVLREFTSHETLLIQIPGGPQCCTFPLNGTENVLAHIVAEINKARNVDVTSVGHDNAP